MDIVYRTSNSKSEFELNKSSLSLTRVMLMRIRKVRYEAYNKNQVSVGAYEEKTGINREETLICKHTDQQSQGVVG